MNESTPEDIEALKARHASSHKRALASHAKKVRRAKKKGLPIPPEPQPKPWVEPGPPQAHITAHLYKWTPHNIGDRLIPQTTNKANVGDWQKVELEFTAPEWGPFVDIRFVVSGGGSAHLDDFALLELP